MRILILLVALAAAGCATDPTSTTAKDVEPAKAASAKPAPAAKSKVVPERIKGAYRVLIKDGEKRYCRKELATGSHVNFRTICLTEAEYQDMQDRDQQALRDATRGPTNPGSVPMGMGGQ